jgi:hypothetical protein
MWQPLSLPPSPPTSHATSLLLLLFLLRILLLHHQPIPLLKILQQQRPSSLSLSLSLFSGSVPHNTVHVFIEPAGFSPEKLVL